MIKILLYGIVTEDNFGGPSLLHGVREIIRGLHEEYEIVCYQKTPIVGSAVSDIGFPILKFPYSRMASFIIDGVKQRFGMGIRDMAALEFWNHLKTSDIVANLYGICFCSNFGRGKYSYLRALKGTVGKFMISVVAKHYGIKTVKCTASYGPVETKNDYVSARFAARRIFDVMYARESESERQMREVAGIEMSIPVSPDLANMMPCEVHADRGKGRIGISVSHQIIRQWKSEESYIDCITSLIEHIVTETYMEVLIIPNETTTACSYNDNHVAEEIFKQVGVHDKVSVLETSEMNSSQLKKQISQCEILVASRYHSCVAGLSSGIPTLVVGWHHKYVELLDHYSQGEWILSSGDCKADVLIEKFDALWKRRDAESEIIMKHIGDVRAKVMEAGKLMFTLNSDNSKK